MAAISLRQFRMVLWGLVVVAAIGATALFVLRPPSTPAPTLAFAQGDYHLVDSTGAPVTEASFRGQPSMVFFGFTHCPDVCPTTLADMATWYEALGPEADTLKAFFITVDPERDPPEVIGAYVHGVTDRVTAVSGAPEEIEKVKTAFGALSEKVPTSDGSYTVNHTATVFLLDRKGEFFGTIAYEEPRDTALAKLKRLAAS